MKTSAAPRVASCWSVSYTHLDVYKRQQLDYSAESDNQVTRLTLSQGWRFSVGSRLNTSIYSEVEKNEGERINHFGVSLNGGSDLFNNISWNGNLSYDKSNGRGATKHLSANLDLTARLNNHWSLIASYLESKNSTTSPFICLLYTSRCV